MPRVYEKRPKKWSEDDMAQAINEVEAGEISIRKAGKKYGMSESNIRQRMKKAKRGENILRPGRKPTLDDDVEKKLAYCIQSLCDHGFSPKTSKILDMVGNFITKHSIDTQLFSGGMPGRDWLHKCLQRNNISMRKAQMVTIAKKATKANPFLVYDFYEQLNAIITEKKLDPHQVWNCKEYGFPTNPKLCKMEDRLFSVSSNAGGENTMILAVCNATGCVLDPTIIFSGEKLHPDWIGNKALPDTWYGVSENGCMSSQLFSMWFEMFTEKVTERPLLMIYDGDLTHLTVDVIENAAEEDITILKFPPHTSDLLQPIEVACFQELKKLWELKLSNWATKGGAKHPLPRAEFVNLLSEIWHQGLSPSNINVGFFNTGIFPLDSSKYPTINFNSHLLQRYTEWIDAGRPDRVLDEIIEEAKSIEKKNSLQRKGDSTLLTSTLKSPTGVIQVECPSCKELGPKPAKAPKGKGWIKSWILVDESIAKASSSQTESTLTTNFEGVQQKSTGSKGKKKRKKTGANSKVVSVKILCKEGKQENLEVREENDAKNKSQVKLQQLIERLQTAPTMAFTDCSDVNTVEYTVESES